MCPMVPFCSSNPASLSQLPKLYLTSLLNISRLFSRNPFALFHTMASVYKFGIELEVLLKPKIETFEFKNGRKLTYQDDPVGLATQVKEIIIEVFNQAGINTVDGDSCQRSPQERYALFWSIVYDGSVASNKGYCAIEIVSPTLLSNEKSSFVQIKKAFVALKQHFEVKTNSTCGTHIHVSVKDKPYSMHRDLIRKIALMVALVDGAAIGKCVPDHRNSNQYCPSAAQYVAQDIAQKFQTNPRQITFGNITGRLNDKEIRPIDSLVELISRKDNLSARWASWNFEYTLPGRCGTIEFRRPPGCVSVEEAHHWVAFTLALIHGALIADRSDISAKYASRRATNGLSVEEMMSNFLKPGADSLGIGQYLTFPLERMKDHIPGSLVSPTEAEKQLKNAHPKFKSSYADKILT